MVVCWSREAHCRLSGQLVQRLGPVDAFCWGEAGGDGSGVRMLGQVAIGTAVVQGRGVGQERRGVLDIILRRHLNLRIYVGLQVQRWDIAHFSFVSVKIQRR